MQPHPIRNNRGVALLITLTITAVLIPTVLEMNRRVRTTLSTTSASRDDVTLRYMASAGIHSAMALLAKDKIESRSDSLQEEWADSDAVNSMLQNLSFADGSLTLVIEDEMSKVQINALIDFPVGRTFNPSQMMLWDRFLRQMIPEDFRSEESNPDVIRNSTKDWLDSNDDDAITGLSGAESSYYQDLDPPYSPRNGPFVHLDELLLVKGYSPELLYGTEELPGMAKYLTVFGTKQTDQKNFTYEGKININTADLPVLSALLPVEYQDMAELMDQWRKEKAETTYMHDLSKPDWYQRIPGMADVEIEADLITTTSDVFRIICTAKLRNRQRTTIAVINRQPNAETGQWICHIVSWLET